MMQDDEEEGSSSRDGVNLATLVAGKNRKISGSPPGVPSPDPLSLRIKLCHNAALETVQTKQQRMADKQLEVRE